MDALGQFTTNGVSPMPNLTVESILETMRSIPKLEPLRVTTRQFVALKRHYGRTPPMMPDNMIVPPDSISGIPVIIDDENPTVPERKRADLVRLIVLSDEPASQAGTNRSTTGADDRRGGEGIGHGVRRRRF